jgi:hypothetical protein
MNRENNYLTLLSRFPSSYLQAPPFLPERTAANFPSVNPGPESTTASVRSDSDSGRPRRGVNWIPGARLWVVQPVSRLAGS